jgi:hypothetical protein
VNTIIVTKDNYFEIAEAIHCWLSLNHEGQSSHTYWLLCQSKFKPGAVWSEQRVTEDNEYFPLINKDNVEGLMVLVNTQLS